MDRERALLRIALREGDAVMAVAAARVALSHALRIARSRGRGSEVVEGHRAARPRASVRRMGASALGVAVLAAATLVVRQGAVATAEIGGVAVASPAPASLVVTGASDRGRVSADVTALPVATPSPTAAPVAVLVTSSPTPAPSPTPRPAPTPTPVTSPPPSATAAPSVAPTPTPSLLPGPLPSGYSRIEIGVGDLVTQKPVTGACISFGGPCGAAQLTNSAGLWWWDFPTGSLAGMTWHVTVSATGYQSYVATVATTGGSQQFIVPLVPAAR